MLRVDSVNLDLYSSKFGEIKMKRRIIGLMVIIAMFGLAIAAFAYAQETTRATTAACCCKKDSDSCPMKGKGHDDKGEHAKMSCCSKHGGDHAKGEDHSKADGHSCDCCGDSCPMKKKDGATAVSSDEKSCCEDCACCKAKTEKPV
jgi:hypothetical protein